MIPTSGGVSGGPPDHRPPDHQGPAAAAVHPPGGGARPWVAPERIGVELDGVADVGPAGADPGGPASPGGRGGWQVTGSPSRDWSDDGPGRAAPPLPTPLAPLTLSDVLDGSWAVITCRPATVLGLSAVLVLPAEVLAAYLVRGRGQAIDPGLVLSGAWSLLSGRIEAPILLALAGLSLGYALLGAAVGRLVAAWYDDTDLSFGQVLAATARRSPAVLVAWVLTSTIQLLALALGLLPALVAFPLLLLVSPVITIERRGPLAAIRRSGRLVRRRYGAVMWAWLMGLLVERAVGAVLAVVANVAAGLASEDVAQVLRPAGWAFAVLVTAPAVAGLCAVLYIDLRIRGEGLDIEIEAGDLLPAVPRPGGGGAR